MASAIPVGLANPTSSSWIASCTSLPQKLIPTVLLAKPLRHSPNPTVSSSSSSSFSPLSPERWRPCRAAADPESAPAPSSELPVVVEPDRVDEEPEAEPAQLAEVSAQAPKGFDIFAVVMVGSRQYIVIPGRTLYTQRLKGASVNDKIILNKVLLVGTKSEAYIGKPVVTNAAVHAVVEEQGLNKKVIVFKYKRKKNYKRTIGHRQPNTRLRITGITGYENYPVSKLVGAQS